MTGAMRLAMMLMLLVISGASSASDIYSLPPLSNVSSYNLALATSLNNTYDDANATHGKIWMEFKGTNIDWVQISKQVELPLIHASARLLSMEPSVDNVTDAAADPSLLFAWGARADPLPAKDWEGSDEGAGDDCVEYHNSSSVSRHALVLFSFGNVSQIVNTTSNVVAVPENVLAAMENTTGNDTLNVKLNATFDFLYTVDDRRPSFESGCSHHLMNFTSSITVVDERNWTVEGNRTLFFVRAPVLGEQWFRNNRFDVVVLSNHRLFSGSISANQNQTQVFILRVFNISDGPYGTKRIISFPSGMDASGMVQHLALNTPTPLDKMNATYAYAYELNYSYEGIGWNMLNITVSSFSGRNYSYSEDVLSRALTHSGGIPEPGVSSNESALRDSVAIGSNQLFAVSLSLGLVGILVAFLLAKKLVNRN